MCLVCGKVPHVQSNDFWIQKSSHNEVLQFQSNELERDFLMHLFDYHKQQIYT